MTTPRCSPPGCASSRRVRRYRRLDDTPERLGPARRDNVERSRVELLWAPLWRRDRQRGKTGLGDSPKGQKRLTLASGEW